MGLRVQNNISSLNTHRQLINSDNALTKSLERLSSGFKINKAADDAAGLAVSMRFRSQIKSLRTGANNAAQGTSLLQVAEGASDQITNILTRLKELATQAASASTSSSDLGKLNNEATLLEQEVDRIANSTKYAGSGLIDGTFGSSGFTVSLGNLTTTIGIVSIDATNAQSATAFTVTINSTNDTLTITSGAVTQVITQTTPTQDTDLDFSALGLIVTVNTNFGNTFTSTDSITTTNASSAFQIGFENNSDNRISFSLSDMRTTALGIAVDLGSLSSAQNALDSIDTAIDNLATARAQIGATQNRFGFAVANIATSVENLTSAESVIRDADIAFETVDFTKNQILGQASVAMLAQANLQPQSLLSLL